MISPSNQPFPPPFDFEFLPLHPDDADAYADADADISYWELVYPDDSDYIYDYISDFESVEPVDLPTLLQDPSLRNSPPSVDHYISGDANPDPAGSPDSVFSGNVGAAGDVYEYNYYDEDEDEDEDDDGLDDELVPRYLRGKMGRERIRKLGKKGCSKMKTSSKKSPFLAGKRGCFGGKHGFGIGLNNNL